MFEKIKRWYKQRLWTDTMVRNAAAKCVITLEQAADILAEQVTL